MAMGNFCYIKNIECQYATVSGQCKDDVYSDLGLCEMEGDNMPKYFEAKRIDNGEFVRGYYMPRPNSPEGHKHYIVTVGSCKWIEIDPNTLVRYRR